MYVGNCSVCGSVDYAEANMEEISNIELRSRAKNLSGTGSGCSAINHFLNFRFVVGAVDAAALYCWHSGQLVAEKSYLR